MKTINQIKHIILTKCPNVKRIYLFGSRANGEFNQKSDIDIAIEGDCDIKKIINEIETLPTLLKIDIVKFEDVNQRLQNRIKNSKILYSSTKSLRYEDALVNFQNALEKFEKILNEKDFFIKYNLEEEFREIAIKRFEYTYETAWRVLKRYLDYLGIAAKSPRAVFKESYAADLIDDEETWLLMIEDRNYTSHVYDDFMIKEIEKRLNRYKDAFKTLYTTLKDNSETL
ncbi:MAG: hypothetical protein GXO62_00860 [Epsilonproteobacteria bacterium]|nr:hypothetical protein [Campylobacterota bacterium]